MWLFSQKALTVTHSDSMPLRLEAFEIQLMLGICDYFFREEKLDSFIPDATLALAEYEKSCHYHIQLTLIGINIRPLRGAGLLLVITARDDGKLVGYFVVIISPNITCAGEKWHLERPCI